MAYGKKPAGKKSGARVTGFFKNAKNPNLFVGKSRIEDIEALIPIIKRAKEEKKEIVWFLYKNQAEEGKPVLSLTADVSEPMKKAGGGNDKGSEDIGL